MFEDICEILRLFESCFFHCCTTLLGQGQYIICTRATRRKSVFGSELGMTDAQHVRWGVYITRGYTSNPTTYGTYLHTLAPFQHQPVTHFFQHWSSFFLSLACTPLVQCPTLLQFLALFSYLLTPLTSLLFSHRGSLSLTSTCEVTLPPTNMFSQHRESIHGQSFSAFSRLFIY